VEKFDTSKELKILKNIGLSEKEAQIYLSAIETGGGTIADLAQAANIERTGIYYHIEKLLSQKLLKTVSRGKRTIYIPVNPDRLKKLADEQQQSFETLFPALQEKFSRQTGKSIIRYYEGEDEVNQFYSHVYEILKALQPPENLICILGTSFHTVSVSNSNFLDFKTPQNQINIRSKTIMPRSNKVENPQGLENHPYIITRYNLPPSELKFISDKYSFQSSVVITPKHIILYDWRNYVFSITENKNNATTWRSFFEFIWDNLK
jgi:predicted transcriptional regulator